MQITIYSLASDDDAGTTAEVFATEREAVNALLDKFELSDAERADLLNGYFAGSDFYQEIADFKSDYDTYSIEEHTLEIDVTVRQQQSL